MPASHGAADRGIATIPEHPRFPPPDAGADGTVPGTVPGTIPWPMLAPEAAGFDRAALADAIRFAETHETPWPRDIRAHLEAGHFEPPPDNEIIGPVAPRGGPTGLILRHGRLVGAWGDTRRADMTFSVAKSYLSILAGLAVADGLIADLDEPVGRTVHDGGFEGPHNGAVTWRHLLTNTSEWEGTLFGKADSIDRNRSLAAEGGTQRKGQRTLAAPGTHWEYNDVRVNRLSLALLRRFGRPLPAVFAERVMRPIGASDEWRWHGYRTSMVELAGRPVESVSGGSHWGGGVFIGAEDQARIGLLMLRRGAWEGRQVIPAGWVAQSVTPCALNPEYGFLWWLNTGRTRWPSAPEASFCAVGAGGNLTWIDPSRDLVAVLRWTDPAAMDGFMAAIGAAFRG
ncbi:beta-lactamase family protein [Roseomonas sp. NAR14]|uniref:Beta-lactamase family protein n=1 Tax=Roseomonas acroporae TaxID=2937791 RepID=A0A9X2BRR8_9PROT|nr:serine hydrolase [Roseomonas acroporae]MCK8782878.1 beta-lactamase family protein [Roseomonas acroporae]